MAPKGAPVWKLPEVLSFFGTPEVPKPGKYLVHIDLCASWGPEGPQDGEARIKKPLTLAGNFEETLAIGKVCDGSHPHKPAKGNPNPGLPSQYPQHLLIGSRGILIKFGCKIYIHVYSPNSACARGFLLLL